MQIITYKYNKLFGNTKADKTLKIRKIIGRFALVWHKQVITLAGSLNFGLNAITLDIK